MVGEAFNHFQYNYSIDIYGEKIVYLWRFNFGVSDQRTPSRKPIDCVDRDRGYLSLDKVVHLKRTRRPTAEDSSLPFAYCYSFDCKTRLWAGSVGMVLGDKLM